MTKKLCAILAILIFILITYITIKKFDTIVIYIDDFIEDLTKEDIIIPENVSEYKRDYKYTTFTITDNFEPYSKEDIINIFYTLLNNSWTSFTFYCPREYENCAKDIRDIANDEKLISLMNNYVSPYNSFINFNTLITGDKTIYISIDKLYNDLEINKSNEELDKIFLNFGIKSDNVSIETIKTLHHYILNNTTYDKEYVEGDFTSDSNKSIGVLVNGKSVCSGYADTLSLMMDRLHIENFKVSSEEHVWNVVKINGEWLHIDATWDDDENNEDNRFNFFLKNTAEIQLLDVTQHIFNKELYKELQ